MSSMEKKKSSRGVKPFQTPKYLPRDVQHLHSDLFFLHKVSLNAGKHVKLLGVHVP